MIEDVARAYIKDLGERNLILIHKLGSIGSIKQCKVHDLLSDLCLREAQKEGFHTVYPGREIGNEASRFVMSHTIPGNEVDALSSVPLARSLIMDLDYYQERRPLNFRLLRIVGSSIESHKFIYNVHQSVNERFFSFHIQDTEFPSLIWLFWNLHVLNVSQSTFSGFTPPIDIWYMSHIRHIDFEKLYIPNPPNVPDDIVLANLQTLGWIKDFTCSEQVVKRIPNIRKLAGVYEEGVDERFCLANLDCLHKLESLVFKISELRCLINYPHSLKKLSIGVETSTCWHDIMDKIGALPLLQKLKLICGTFKGQWETTDGQFRSLKFLYLKKCEGLQVWTSEASHFPRLELLDFNRMDDLKEIPSDFAEIPTLGAIDLFRCPDSTIESAKRILEEQEALYGEEETTLRIGVWLWEGNDPALESLRSRNFHVTWSRTSL